MPKSMKAGEVSVGDVIYYCGANYEVLEISPPDSYGLILFHTIKRVGYRVLSDSFNMVRHEKEEVTVR